MLTNNKPYNIRLDILKRSENPITAFNYYAAPDLDVSIARSLLTMGVDAYNLYNSYGIKLPTGLSNCTLTATLWVNPNRPLGRASTIINDGGKYGYALIPENYSVPGDLVIAKNPDLDSYHTMLMSGYVKSPQIHTFMGKDYYLPAGHPLVRYSNGSSSTSSYREKVGLKEYLDNSHGKTDVSYWRYLSPGSMEILMPEITVTPTGVTTDKTFLLIARPVGSLKKAKILLKKLKSGGIIKGLEDISTIPLLGNMAQLIITRAKASSVKPTPNLNEVLKETWANENPRNKGRQPNGTWKPYYDNNKKQWLIGPGFDYKQNGYDNFNDGATTEEINKAVRKYHQHSLDLIDNVYLPRFTNRPDTISPQIKRGLIDLRYLTGNLKSWNKLGEAIATGDLKNILQESVVGETPERNRLRTKNNWHYK